MSTRQKKKPTPGASESGPENDASDAPTSPTVSHAPSPVNPARSRLARILDVASDLSCDEGRPGQYTRSGQRIYWLDDRSEDAHRVGTIVAGGDLVVLPKARERHEPLEMACHLKADAQHCGGSLVVEGVAS